MISASSACVRCQQATGPDLIADGSHHQWHLRICKAYHSLIEQQLSARVRVRRGHADPSALHAKAAWVTRSVR